LYNKALDINPNSTLFAQAIGCMEFQLRVYKNARQQAVK